MTSLKIAILGEREENRYDMAFQAEKTVPG